MPGALRNRTPLLPGFGLALGITILPLLLRRDFAMFHSSKLHLAEAGESYTEHLSAAVGISVRLAAASAACALHAIVPGLCTRSASRRVARVHARLVSRATSSDDFGCLEFDAHRPRHIEIVSP